MESILVIKILIPATLAFFVGILMTPFLTNILYKHEAWKKRGGKIAMDGSEAKEFNALHGDLERHVPRMGGIIVWGSSLITLTLISLLAYIFPSVSEIQFEFLSRSQTWIPCATLVLGAFVGLYNDILDIRGVEHGMSLKRRLLFVTALSGCIGWWFYAKVGVTTIAIPFFGFVPIGIFIIPLFIAMSLSLYASGVIDGVDGLAGGVFAIIFAAYAFIAFEQGQSDIAAFSLMLVGALLAFTWFNIPPARFYMTETGTMSLTLTLAVIAFMTDTIGGGAGISALVIIGFPLVATVLSVVIQVVSKKIRKKKVFRSAPLHHHFEAVGWPSYKVSMRYWIFTIMTAFLGVLYALAF